MRVEKGKSAIACIHFPLSSVDMQTRRLWIYNGLERDHVLEAPGHLTQEF